jgi:hypothetical protein
LAKLGGIGLRSTERTVDRNQSAQANEYMAYTSPTEDSMPSDTFDLEQIFLGQSALGYPAMYSGFTPLTGTTMPDLAVNSPASWVSFDGSEHSGSRENQAGWMDTALFGAQIDLNFH